MKPIFSDEERAQAVKNFIVARYHKQAKITDFNALVSYLNDGGIKVLCGLQKSGKTPVHGDAVGYVTTMRSVFTEGDAKVYFEWLVSAASGGREVPEDIVKQANNQLFQIIHILGDQIHMEKSVQLLYPYDWKDLFSSFDQRLTEMRKMIDKGDKDIIDVLKPILEFMKRNTKLLDALQKENERIFGKGDTHG